MPLALVLGGAECVWKDTVAALEIFEPDAYIAVNDMIPRWPLRLDFAASLHPEKLEQWLRGRKIAGYNTNCEVWSHKYFREIVTRSTTDWQGSSGLFAAKIMLQLGFSVVLAGVPMDYAAGHILRKKDWVAASMFRNGWSRHRKDLEANVRSMSGWTCGLLGKPTPNWLERVGSAPANHDVVAKIKEKADGRIKDSVG